MSLSLFDIAVFVAFVGSVVALSMAKSRRWGDNFYWQCAGMVKEKMKCAGYLVLLLNSLKIANYGLKDSNAGL